MSINDITGKRKKHWGHGRAVFRRPDVPDIDPIELLVARLETVEQHIVTRILETIVERERNKKETDRPGVAGKVRLG